MTGDIEVIVGPGPRAWSRFTRVTEVLVAGTPGDVAGVLQRAEACARDGLCAVGVVQYEAAAAFDLPCLPPGSAWPLAWFAIVDPRDAQPFSPVDAGAGYTLGAPARSRGWEAFARGFARIREEIAAGNTYQVNDTFQLEAPFHGDPRALFADLVAAQGAGTGTFIRVGDRAICSASPELFFERVGDRITMRPMKGTARRGRYGAEDDRAADRLQHSAKERAENVMVVDMVRNDLGRIAKVGSVSVTAMCSVERYPNVWQMTSTVTAASDAPLDRIFAATFPCASVTGAPKHQTMAIIREVEAAPRGVYTGAIGWVAPGGDARFQVAIRTAVVDGHAGVLRFGVGSGIVWDSDAAAEYQECLVKGSILGRHPVVFELLETLRWDPVGGFFLLDEHLSRMRTSARFFGRPCLESGVRAVLDQVVEGAAGPQRVRLLLAEDGTARAETASFTASAGTLRVALAASPIDSTDVWLFHKTTSRDVYARARASAPDVDDVVLWNERGEVTESTLANVVIEHDGQRVTPPVECGLLGGTFRAWLLARGDVVEGRIRVEELRRADRVWLVNSVRGWCPAVLR